MSNSLFMHCLQEIYVTSSKRQKKAISQSIVDAIRSMKPPGRFLEKNPTTGLYNDVGDQKAIEKTSQALRDGAASLRKQLSEDMRDPDFLSAVFDTDEHGNPKEPERKEQDKKPEQTTCTDLDSIPDIVVSAKEKAKEKEKPKSPMKKVSMSFDESRAYIGSKNAVLTLSSCSNPPPTGN